MLCNGQSLPIEQYQALYSVLGFRYGGDGKTTFMLPNIQGSVLVGNGPLKDTTYEVGQRGGDPGVSLLTTQIPAHFHLVNGMVTKNPDLAPTIGVSVPTNKSYLSNVFGVPPPTTKRKGTFYAPAPSDNTYLNKKSVDPTGENKPHNNMQPYLVISYCICTTGTPPRPRANS
ncbi:MAG: tail fiber protein [Chitinophagaceae bacterium]